ncbi:MAG: protein-disulfide reductase DsbD N-terminal domain-containing protein [Phycisphaerales bacterium]|nr:protein-disulfide reductase DsbD N-terminal domain-containing protein [Phycisphaerales bacterium]
MKQVLAWCITAALVTGAYAQSKPIVHMEAAPLRTTVGPGGTHTVAVRFTIPKHWHIYWQDAGEAGSPTELEIKAPPKAKIGPVRYSRPKQIQDPAGVVIGYEDVAVLMFDVTLDPSIAADRWVDLAIEGRWLVCKKVCYMDSKPLHLRLRVDNTTPQVGVGQAWVDAVSMPRTLPGSIVQRPGVVELRPGITPTAPSFIAAHVPGVALQPARFAAHEGQFAARIAYRLSSRDAMGHRPRLQGLLMQGDAATDPCWWVDVRLPSPVETDSVGTTKDALEGAKP